MKKILFSAISVLFISAAFVACTGNKSNETTETSLGAVDSTTIVSDTVTTDVDTVAVETVETVEITNTEVVSE